MYRPTARPSQPTPFGELLAFLDGLSMPKLGLLLLVCGGVLFCFVAFTQQERPVRRIYASNVPGAIYEVNGGQPAIVANTGPAVEPADAAVSFPKYANLLETARHITSEFGHYPNGSVHYGIDLDAWYGEVQYAPVGGVVTEVLRGCIEGDTSCGKGWGNHVWFRSEQDGKYVLMAHFAEIFDDIQEAVTFSAGHPLGKTGSTGYSSGPHVHLQVNSAGMQNQGSENPAWVFPWLRCGEPMLGNFFGSEC